MLTELLVPRISYPFATKHLNKINQENVKLASTTHSHMTHQHHTHNCFCDKTTVEISLFVLPFGLNINILTHIPLGCAAKLSFKSSRHSMI